MTTEIVLPRCPDCDVQGLEYIVSEGSKEEHGTGDEWFNVAFCSKCGHVYGVFNKFSMQPFTSKGIAPKNNPFGEMFDD